MNEDSRELKLLRAMAWERAKGEINSMKHTYYGEEMPDGLSKFEELERLSDEFFKSVEDYEIHT